MRTSNRDFTSVSVAVTVATIAIAWVAVAVTAVATIAVAWVAVAVTVASIAIAWVAVAVAIAMGWVAVAVGVDVLGRQVDRLWLWLRMVVVVWLVDEDKAGALRLGRWVVAGRVGGGVGINVDGGDTDGADGCDNSRLEHSY